MTFIIPEQIKAAIADHARANPDIEVCGYWLRDLDKIVPVENIAKEPSKSFQIDPDVHAFMMEVSEDVIIYHSHTGEDTEAILSEADIVSSKALKIPYILFHQNFAEWDYFDPSNLDPYPLVNNPNSHKSVDFYLGHRWQWERWDCYSLFRNFYKGFLGIELKDFSRKGDENSILASDWNQYTSNFESQNFRKLEEDEPLKNYDVLLLNLVGNQVHHSIIVIDAEKKIGIQMLGQNRLSEKLLIRNAEMNRTKLIIRHKKFDV